MPSFRNRHAWEKKAALSCVFELCETALCCNPSRFSKDPRARSHWTGPRCLRFVRRRPSSLFLALSPVHISSYGSCFSTTFRCPKASESRAQSSPGRNFIGVSRADFSSGSILEALLMSDSQSSPSPAALLAPLVAIVGPTASGKSSLGVCLAERLNGEILACDSTQVYRGFDVGTAKPSAGERREVPHHLLDLLEPHELFTAGEYRKRAIAVLDDLRGRGRVPI